jgi:hypothetical protein
MEGQEKKRKVVKQQPNREDPLALRKALLGGLTPKPKKAKKAPQTPTKSANDWMSLP